MKPNISLTVPKHNSLMNIIDNWNNQARYTRTNESDPMTHIADRHRRRCWPPSTGPPSSHSSGVFYLHFCYFSTFWFLLISTHIFYLHLSRQSHTSTQGIKCEDLSNIIPYIIFGTLGEILFTKWLLFRSI